MHYHLRANENGPVERVSEKSKNYIKPTSYLDSEFDYYHRSL